MSAAKGWLARHNAAHVLDFTLLYPLLLSKHIVQLDKEMSGG